MKRFSSSRLLNDVLVLLLSPRDRETISGDLYEEYADLKCELGPFKAHLWYLRQILSFVPGRVMAILAEGTLLRVVCFCTALTGGWLGMMDIVLHHHGYGTVVAATIVCQALLTLASLRFRRLRGLYAGAMLGSLVVLTIALRALQQAFGGADFEGYILLTALALVVQAMLTLVTLPRMRAGRGA